MPAAIHEKRVLSPEKAFQNPSLFTTWKDPKSGVESHILTRRVAPFQQSFYFVNPSTTSDGRYYWFYCSFPPSGNHNYGRCLGVLDFETGEMHCYPETQFLDASPGVHPETGEVFWCSGLDVWKRGPKPGDRVAHVNRLPEELALGRRPWRVATHLTFSANRKSLNLDAEIGCDCFVGEIPLDGTAVRVWQKFDRCYNHGQFSPTDPELQLIAQDSATNPATGKQTHIDNRMWLIRAGEPAFPIFPKGGSTMHGHEWWSANGERVWYVHYHRGVECVDIKDIRPGMKEDPKPTLAWNLEPVSHAHTDSRERWIVGDVLPPQEKDSCVLFHDRETGRTIPIASFMPYLSPGMSKYHIHPHPQFCLNDEYICYTTMVLGQVDVAFVSVRHLLNQ